MSSQQKPGGSAKKIGRNKKKCERYRLRKGSLTNDGNKKPKGIGNFSKLAERRRQEKLGGYVDDTARMKQADFDRLPTFRPVRPRPHLVTELIETGQKRGGIRGREYVEDGEAMVFPLRDPRMHRRVRTVPRRSDKVGGGR